MTADDLYFLAAINGIKVIFTNLQKIHAGRLGEANAETMVIKLDHSLKHSPRRLKCVLAEEIGHILYPPRPGHIRYHARDFAGLNAWEPDNIKVIVSQDEQKARRWATSILVPDVEFWRAKEEDGVNTLHGFAERFDVEEWFVALKIGYLRVKARGEGRRLKWRDLIRRDRH